MPPSCPKCRVRPGAKALNGALRYGGTAGRYSAQVSNAFLGTQHGDLSRLILGAGQTFGAFASHEADLKGLIDNFEVFTGALADQSANLSTTIRLLSPTLKTTHTSLVSLDRTLPPLRTYAIELTPAVAELPGLISASKPWLKQVRPLLSGKEGGGAARLLRTDPRPRRGRPGGQGQSRCPSSTSSASARRRCWYRPGNQTIERPVQHRRAELPRILLPLSNFAGVGQNFDGNGPYLRLQPGGGDSPRRRCQPD